MTKSSRLSADTVENLPQLQRDYNDLWEGWLEEHFTETLYVNPPKGTREEAQERAWIDFILRGYEKVERNTPTEFLNYDDAARPKNVRKPSKLNRGVEATVNNLIEDSDKMPYLGSLPAEPDESLSENQMKTLRRAGELVGKQHTYVRDLFLYTHIAAWYYYQDKEASLQPGLDNAAEAILPSTTALRRFCDLEIGITSGAGKQFNKAILDNIAKKTYVVRDHDSDIIESYFQALHLLNR